MSISVSNVRVPGANAWAKRVTLPGNVRSGILGHANDRFDSAAHSERRVLRHIDLGADDVALHQREHERVGAGLHEAAHVDVALGDDAVKRRDHALVGLLLIEDPDQRLLSRDVRLGDRDRRLLRLKGQAVGVALLRRHPPLLDQARCRDRLVTCASSLLACVCCNVAWFWPSVAWA